MASTGVPHPEDNVSRLLLTSYLMNFFLLLHLKSPIEPRDKSGLAVDWLWTGYSPLSYDLFYGESFRINEIIRET